MAELADSCDSLEHRKKGEGSGYGLRHDRLVAGKCEGRFCCKDARVHIFETRSHEPDLKHRKEIAPTGGRHHGKHRDHEAAKHLKAANIHSIKPSLNRNIGQPEEAGSWEVSTPNFQYHLCIRKCYWADFLPRTSNLSAEQSMSYEFVYRLIFGQIHLT